MSISSDHPWTDEELRAARITFRAWTLPVSGVPLVLSEEELQVVRQRTKAVSRAAELAVAAFPESGPLRSLYAYSPLQEQCVTKDPGYRPLIPLGRWDSFLFPDGPRFMEYNTDGAAGWYYSAALSGLWRRTRGLPEEADPLPNRLLRAILHCFRQWDERGIENPRMALVDWAEVGTRSEQEALAEQFSAMGVPTSLEDPRAMRAEGGRLTGQRGSYDLVYRRLVSEEAFSRVNEIRPFFDAYLDGTACFVGGFRTDPAWHKGLFVVLSDPTFRGLFPGDLHADLDASIPWSRVLRPGTVTFEGAECDFEELLLMRPDDFLLKPLRGYEGRGVIAGAFSEEGLWRRSVIEGLTRGDTLVQSMLRPSPQEAGESEARYYQAGEYVLLGRLAGFLARSSQTPLITPDSPERYHPISLEVSW